MPISQTQKETKKDYLIPPKIEEWDTFYELTKSMDGQDIPQLRGWIQYMMSQTRLSTIEELKDEAMKEYGLGYNNGRQVAIEEAKGCVPEKVPEQKNIIVMYDTGFNTAISQMLENLNKLK